MANAQYQREYRASLKRQGYKRLDVQISPRLWAKLRPWLGPHAYTHPGSSLVEFLESLELEEPTPE